MKGIELDREQLKQYIQGTPATIPTAFDNRFNLDNIKMKFLNHLIKRFLAIHHLVQQNLDMLLEVKINLFIQMN